MSRDDEGGVKKPGLSGVGLEGKGKDDSGLGGVGFLTRWQVPTLKEVCIKTLQNNVNALDYLGEVPYYLIKPVLERCTPAQLANIEFHNEHIMDESDELWKGHSIRDFIDVRRSHETGTLKEPESWRELYEDKQHEAEEKMERLGERLRNVKQNMEKEREARKVQVLNGIVPVPKKKTGWWSNSDHLLGRSKLYNKARRDLKKLPATRPVIHTQQMSRAQQHQQHAAAQAPKVVVDEEGNKEAAMGLFDELAGKKPVQSKTLSHRKLSASTTSSVPSTALQSPPSSHSSVSSSIAASRSHNVLSQGTKRRSPTSTTTTSSSNTSHADSSKRLRSDPESLGGTKDIAHVKGIAQRPGERLKPVAPQTESNVPGAGGGGVGGSPGTTNSAMVKRNIKSSLFIKRTKQRDEAMAIRRPGARA
ncbi:hypothetical protein HK102_007757 [Quaeritorhiza haematococci]|nr:hypothetical protein HK102_007757 [Quaeritorhiza haematococci]